MVSALSFFPREIASNSIRRRTSFYKLLRRKMMISLDNWEEEGE